MKRTLHVFETVMFCKMTNKISFTFFKGLPVASELSLGRFRTRWLISWVSFSLVVLDAGSLWPLVALFDEPKPFEVVPFEEPKPLEVTPELEPAPLVSACRQDGNANFRGVLLNSFRIIFGKNAL